MNDPVSLQIMHITTTARLTVLIEQATVMVEGMGRVHDDDHELAPELHAAMVALGECVHALRRAHDFSKARLEVATGSG